VVFRRHGEPVLSALRGSTSCAAAMRAPTHAVVPELRRWWSSGAEFMDDDFGIADKADAIFCRNVIIYFDRPRRSAFSESWRTIWCRADTCCRSLRDAARYGFPLAPWRRALQRTDAEADRIVLEVYVQPGESHLVSEPAFLRTVLGSCVG